jgi:hypothetical protein
VPFLCEGDEEAFDRSGAGGHGQLSRAVENVLFLARAGALAGSGLRIAEMRTREVLADALGGDAAQDIVASRERLDGVEVVRVRVTARLPLLGTLGPTALTVDGHAIGEQS